MWLEGNSIRGLGGQVRTETIYATKTLLFLMQIHLFLNFYGGNCLLPGQRKFATDFFFGQTFLFYKT